MKKELYLIGKKAIKDLMKEKIIMVEINGKERKGMSYCRYKFIESILEK